MCSSDLAAKRPGLAWELWISEQVATDAGPRTTHRRVGNTGLAE